MRVNITKTLLESQNLFQDDFSTNSVNFSIFLDDSLFTVFRFYFWKSVIGKSKHNLYIRAFDINTSCVSSDRGNARCVLAHQVT